MAQLETITFFSQIFWIFLTFFTFYLLIYIKIIPQICFKIKMIMNYYPKIIKSKVFLKEKKNIEEKNRIFLKNSLKLVKLYFVKRTNIESERIKNFKKNLKI